MISSKAGQNQDNNRRANAAKMRSGIKSGSSSVRKGKSPTYLKTITLENIDLKDQESLYNNNNYSKTMTAKESTLKAKQWRMNNHGTNKAIGGHSNSRHNNNSTEKEQDQLHIDMGIQQNDGPVDSQNTLDLKPMRFYTKQRTKNMRQSNSWHSKYEDQYSSS